MLGVGEIRKECNQLNKTLAEFGVDMVGKWWHPRWVPFASHINADALFVDHRPGASFGAVGKFRHAGTPKLLGLEVLEFFQRFHRSLLDGSPLLGEIPAVQEGRLSWGN
jgi:cell wall assembly regulator SMI1